MRHILMVMLIIVLLCSGPGVLWAQVLTWDANTEPDLDGYMLWSCPAGTVTCDTTTGDRSGVGLITTNMFDVSSWGAIAQFFVTAVDTSGNESAASNVCYFDPGDTSTWGPGVCAVDPALVDTTPPAPPSNVTIE